MRTLISVGTCVLVGLIAVAAQEQQQQPQQPPQAPKQEEPIQGPTFRTGIDLVAVDVSVVDRRGRPVEDLRAPEFAVKIDGELRRVVSAELIKVDVEAARKQVADKTESFYTSNLTPPNGRQIVIAVDQVNIRPGSLRPVLDAAGRFLDMLSPLDQVAFVAYPEPGPRVNFTNDKLRLRRAMLGLVGQQPRARPGTYNIGVSEAISIEERRDQIVLSEVIRRECKSNDPRQLAQCERDITSESSQIARNSREDADLSLRGLQQLLEQLSYVDGPKSLILISEGLAVSETNDLRHLVRLAGAARTAINVMSVDLRRGDVTIAEQPPTEAEDRRHPDAGPRGDRRDVARQPVSASPARASRSSSGWHRRSPRLTCSASSSGRATASAIDIESTSKCGVTTSRFGRGRPLCCRPRERSAARHRRTFGTRSRSSVCHLRSATARDAQPTPSRIPEATRFASWWLHRWVRPAPSPETSRSDSWSSTTRTWLPRPTATRWH